MRGEGENLLTIFFSFTSSSLLGPRRKISLALAELKEKDDDNSTSTNSVSCASLGAGVRGEEEVSGGRDSGIVRSRVRAGSSRPPLFKQPSTELQAAYHQVKKVHKAVGTPITHKFMRHSCRQ